MTAIVMPTPKPQFLDANGDPLVGGKIYTYAAGTTTPKATYSDAAGTVPQTNPIILNALGEPPSAVFWTGSYQVIIRDALDNLIYSVDGFQAPIGPNDLSAAAGAGLIGFDSNGAYPVGSLGAYLIAQRGTTGASTIGYGVGTVASALADLNTRLTAQREQLAANRTYYVRTDGNDANLGTSNTAGGAWKTLQKASDFIASKIDLNGFSVTVNVADGTYSAGVLSMAPYIGRGNVYYIGNVSNPSACVISCAALAAFYAERNAGFDVRGFRVTNTAGDGVYAQIGGIITVGAMEYGPCLASQITVGGGAFVLLGSDYKITAGTSSSHLHAGSPGLIVGGSITVTITGTPNYTAYFAGAAEGSIVIKDVIFSGAATGTTHLAHKNGVIDTHPGFASLPGSVPGRQATGGSLIGSQATPFQIAPNQAQNNTVRIQSYNVTTATFADRFVVDSQPTGNGGGYGWAFVNGDNSYFSGATHFGGTLPVTLATGNDGMTTTTGSGLFASQSNQKAASWRRNGSVGTLHDFFYGGAGAALVGSISVSTTTTTYNTSSDYRLKDYIGPISGAWDRVKQIKTADFTFKAEPETVVHGFLAHELAESHLLAVSGHKDETQVDPDTGKRVPLYQGVDPSKLVGDLTAALQEAMARIESLEEIISQPRKATP